jgi:transcriptional regulator with XRE-family HTH domain
VSSLEAGKRLRAERERLRLSTRVVERLTQKLARERKNRALFVSHNWLSDVENGRFMPSFAKLYSLSLIYERNVDELLAMFGLSFRDFGRDRGLIALPETHLIRSAIAEVPAPLSPQPRVGEKPVFKHTSLVHRMLQDLSDIPLFLLQQADPRHSLYGYIGTEDYTLHPLIRPGTFVQIDSRQTKVAKGVWLNEHDRPIYFTELRDNRYACSWCEIEGNNLFLIPSPRSPVPIRQVRYPQDAEIVGRVTVITMQIAQS